MLFTVPYTRTLVSYCLLVAEWLLKVMVLGGRHVHESPIAQAMPFTRSSLPRTLLPLRLFNEEYFSDHNATVLDDPLECRRLMVLVVGSA